MDTKIEISETSPVIEVASENDKGFFTKYDAVQRNSNAVFLYDDCNMALKTEVKSEVPFPGFCLKKEREFLNKHVAKERPEAVMSSNSNKLNIKIEVEEHILASDCSSHNGTEFPQEDPILKNQTKPETVACSNNCKMNIKIETEEETLFTDSDSQNKTESLQGDSVGKEYNIDHEMGNKIEITEEYWWLETKDSSVCEGVKDEKFCPVKYARSYREAFSGDSSGKLLLPPAKDLRSDASLHIGKDSPVQGNSRSNSSLSYTTEKHCMEDNIHSEQYSNCNNVGKTSSNAAYLKQNNVFRGAKVVPKCEICDKKFARLRSLKAHYLNHEGIKPHECTYCVKRFTKLSQLKAHTLIHEGKQPHKCEICEKKFTNLADLKTHNLIHEGRKPHKCEICEKRFTQLAHLKSHNLIHDGKKPHKCEICDKRFARLSDFKRHNLSHEAKRTHKCEICDKRFARLLSLKEHTLMHKGKKAHKCEICGKRFTLLSRWEKHKLTHEQNKPTEGEICNKEFTQLSSLKVHNLIPEDKRPYKCAICDKSFTQLSSLKLHTLILEGKKH